MSIKISSTVTKARTAPNTWIACTAACDNEAEPADRYAGGRVGTAPSFRDALALASTQRDEVDAELMEQVHESRASRRVRACELCVPALTGPTLRCAGCAQTDMMHSKHHPHPALDMRLGCDAFQIRQEPTA